jgi:phage gpG-like protein
MPGLFVDIEVFGDRQISREILRVGIRSRNLEPVWRSVFRHMDEIHSEQFLTKGERGGTPWLDLKPATIIAKVREGSKTPDWPERRTDALYEAMSSPSSPNREEIYNGEWALFRVIGDPGEYGPIQQQGAASINLPARPLSVFTPIDREEIIKEIQLYVRRGIVRHFL